MFVQDRHFDWDHGPHIKAMMFTMGFWAPVWAALYLLRDRNIYR